MRYNEIIFALQSDIGGGQASQSTAIDSAYLKKSLPSYRASWIRADYYKSVPQILNPSCYQRVYLLLDTKLQSSAPKGAVIFKIPKFINIGNEDGLRYGGTLSDIDQNEPLTVRTCIKQWTRLYNRAQLATIQSHPYTCMENNPDTVYFLMDNNMGRLEVYNEPTITEGMVEGVLSNPLEAPNFNQITDEYPISEDAIKDIRQAIYVERTSIDSYTPTDNKFNTADQPAVRPPYYRQPPRQ